MHKKQRQSLILTLTVMAVLIFSSAYSSAYAAGDMTEAVESQQEKLSHYFKLKGTTIGIFYDSGNELTLETGESLFYSLSLMTPNIIGIPITSFDQINMVMDSEDIDIALYVFPSDYNGMKITERASKTTSIAWETVADTLKSDIIHVFATGNTLQLFNHVSPDLLVYGPNTEKEDAQQLFVFALWTLADVLEEHYEDSTSLNFAEDIRMASLQYFADNFNQLTARTIEPQDVMGLEHPDTVAARTQAYYDRNPVNFTKNAHEGYEIDPETLREIDPLTGEIRQDYGIDIFPKTSSTSSDFILQLLPAESGLRGPLGGIIDELLGWLFDAIGGAIGLDDGTVENIANALFSIPELVGAIADPSASKIKGFIDDIIPMLPIPQDLTQYIDLIVDALFLLRGEVSDVLSFILGAVDLLVPEGFTLLGQPVSTLLGTVFDLAGKVEGQISAGGNIADVILSVINEEMIKFVVNQTISKASGLFSMNTGQVTQGVDFIVGTIGIIVNLIATGNFNSIVETYGPKLLDVVLGAVLPDITEDQSKIIMKLLSMVLTTAGVMDGPTLEEVLTDIVLQDLGINGLTLHYVYTDGISEQAVAAGAKVKAIIDKVGNVIAALKDGSYSLATFQSDLDTLLTELAIDEALKTAIKDVLAIVVAISDSSFDLGSAVNIGSMITSLLTSFGIFDTAQAEIITKVLNALVGVVSFIKNPPNLKAIIKDLIPDLDDLPGLLNDLLNFIVGVIPGLNYNQALELNSLPSQVDTVTGQALDATDVIKIISDTVGTIIQIVGSGGDNALEGIMKALLTGATFVINKVLDVDITPFVELLKGIFGTVIGITDSAPSLDDMVALIIPLVPDYAADIETLLKFVMKIKDVFNDGFRTIFTQLTAWLASTVIDMVSGLSGEVEGALGGVQDDSFELFNLEIPIGIGGFSLFTIKIGIGLEPGFQFDVERLSEMIFDLVFRGVQIFDQNPNFGEVLKTAFQFFSITPILVASFELSDFGSGESSFITFLLETLGVQLSFSGYGYFKLQLFSFKNGNLNMDDFFKVIEWGFGFKITISKTLTLLDFLTGGAGGSLNSIGKYIGLDAISITIAFSIGLDIVKRAATATAPETGSMTITFGITFHVQLGIDIVIAKLILFGTLDIVLTLLQDLVAPTPLRVFISIQLTIGVTIGFLFFEWTFDYKWSPGPDFAPPKGHEITSNSPEDAASKGALGGDTDKDGLSDEYEDKTPGLDKNKPDSDDDGLDDKFETQTTKTNPGLADSDQDGLNDDIELYNILTDPLNPDTDFDGLLDGEEAGYYQTSPLELDTDGDGLDDFYEVKHSWNMSQITPSVTQGVYIGDELMFDHTDPLNPDTDGDGLLDGEEGERGMHYGPELYPLDLGEDGNGDEIPPYAGDPPLVFNGGYTHPLDNDTDDDSYWQLYDGSIAPVEIRYLGIDMSDLREVQGLTFTKIDEFGIPGAPETKYTNPTNPDTDGDTGVTAAERIIPPFGAFLSSDGYELSRDPQTDPLDADTDDDGLIDGLEGMLRVDSNHTDGNNADTDGDGLGDMQELTLGSDPRSIDTDLDGVTDGDEFFRFHTNPFLPDSDYDGVEDGEEVYTYHTNPMQKDSDIDGLSDYEEIWVYFSNPMDEDGDNDFLTDWEEIFITYTDPFDADSDDDGLFDGEEIQGFIVQSGTAGEMYNVTTDPNKWDTDEDSLLTLDQFGEISQSMSDYDEYLLGTNPTIRDTDLDGVEDGWELYLGKGTIPWLEEPIPMDPLNNDTDGDGLLDGTEMYIANVTTLLNPYIAFILVSPFNTSATNADSDGDFLDDAFELRRNFNPSSNDTDNDTLSDYAEWVIYDTKVNNNDSDGDGLSDAQEVNGIEIPLLENGLKLNAIIFTDPLDSDSDNDLLPDGAEVYRYNRNPANPDENNNEILDGMEIDSDGDGLMDGEEFYVWGTQQVGGVSSPGGVDNVDSDHDGLFDGYEAYVSFTSPIEWDTDGDNVSDGLEHFCGTDMLDNSTSDSELESCFAQFITITILSPAATTYNTNSIPVIVYDKSNSMVSMEYRYRQVDQNNWSSSVPMSETADEAYWEADYLDLPKKNGTWILEVTSENALSQTFTRQVEFELEINLFGLSIITPEEKTYSFNEFEDAKLPIKVDAGINYVDVWYRMIDKDGVVMTNDTPIEFDEGLGLYHQPSYNFPDDQGTHKYTLEVHGETIDGVENVVTSTFKIKKPTLVETVAYIAVPVVLGGGLIYAVSTSSRFKNPFKKEGL